MRNYTSQASYSAAKGRRTLGGIYTAEDRDPLFGITRYLVTEQSMRESGYTLITQEGECRG